jgi:outer membrane lipoprotein-sorting protein
MKRIFILSFLPIWIIFLSNGIKGEGIGKDFIEKIILKYSNLDSYQDSGYVLEKVIYDTKEAQIYKPFKIYFLKPDKLRIEWKAQLFPNSPHIQCVLWTKKNETFTYWETGKFEKMKDLRDGIYANAGISSSITATIPCLLTGIEPLTFDLKKITKVLSSEEEEFDNTLCIYLKVKDKDEKIWEIWVGKEDFLLRKIRRTLIKGVAEEVHQNIKINEEINPEIFDFEPEKSK